MPKFTPQVALLDPRPPEGGFSSLSFRSVFHDSFAPHTKTLSPNWEMLCEARPFALSVIFPHTHPNPSAPRVRVRPMRLTILRKSRGLIPACPPQLTQTPPIGKREREERVALSFKSRQRLSVFLSSSSERVVKCGLCTHNTYA